VTERRPLPQAVLATHNPHKLEELVAMGLAPCYEWVSLSRLGITAVPDENGLTFRDNALIKAMAARKASGLPALADDSGLEIMALDGKPGIHSSVFAGVGASDQAHYERVLQMMEGKEDRRARFVCVLCFVKDEEAVFFEGTLNGTILQRPQGQGGFGYDPVFEADEKPGLSLAELGPEGKNSLSHRRKALRLFQLWLSAV
jgi:XTP/dITP diphosphohydrolase